MIVTDMDRIDRQKKEFDTLAVLARAFNALPAIVDDEYPEMRHRYESALRDFIRALEDNNRVITGTVVDPERRLK